MVETSIERVQGDIYCCVYTAERKFLNKLSELKEKYPEEVQYIAINEDGSVVAHVPFNWLRFVGPPKTINLTEEQRKTRAERMRQLVKNKENN